MALVPLANQRNLDPRQRFWAGPSMFGFPGYGGYSQMQGAWGQPQMQGSYGQPQMGGGMPVGGYTDSDAWGNPLHRQQGSGVPLGPDFMPFGMPGANYGYGYGMPQMQGSSGQPQMGLGNMYRQAFNKQGAAAPFWTGGTHPLPQV